MPELPDLDEEALASTTNLETLNGVEEALDIIQRRIETARQNFEFFKALPASKLPQVSDGLNTSFNNRLHEYAVRNISLLRKRRVHAEKDAVLFKMLQNAAADSLDELRRHNGVTITDIKARAEAQSSKTGKIQNVVALQGAIKRHFMDTLLELGRPQSELSEVALGRPDGTAVELLPILFKESLISKTTGSAEEVLETLRKQQNLQDVFKKNEETALKYARVENKGRIEGTISDAEAELADLLKRVEALRDMDDPKKTGFKILQSPQHVFDLFNEAASDRLQILTSLLELYTNTALERVRVLRNAFRESIENESIQNAVPDQQRTNKNSSRYEGTKKPVVAALGALHSQTQENEPAAADLAGLLAHLRPVFKGNEDLRAGKLIEILEGQFPARQELLDEIRELLEERKEDFDKMPRLHIRSYDREYREYEVT